MRPSLPSGLGPSLKAQVQKHRQSLVQRLSASSSILSRIKRERILNLLAWQSSKNTILNDLSCNRLGILISLLRNLAVGRILLHLCARKSCYLIFRVAEEGAQMTVCWRTNCSKQILCRIFRRIPYENRQAPKMRSKILNRKKKLQEHCADRHKISFCLQTRSRTKKT